MQKLTRMDVLQKSITVFEAIRRMASKGNAGQVPEVGAEEEYNTVDECIRIMKEWMREIKAGTARPAIEPNVPKVGELEDYDKVTRIADWQREVMENGAPEELRLT